MPATQELSWLGARVSGQWNALKSVLARVLERIGLSQIAAGMAHSAAANDSGTGVPGHASTEGGFTLTLHHRRVLFLSQPLP